MRNAVEKALPCRSLWHGMISTQTMAHVLQYMPLPAPCLKLDSGSQSCNQPLIMLFALVTC